MEEHDIFLSYLRVTQHMSQQFRTHFGRLDLTFPQALVLTVLGEDGPVPISTLAERTGSANSTVSGIVDRLEKLGLAQRQRSETDRRVIYVCATEKYRQLRRRAGHRRRGLFPFPDERYDAGGPGSGGRSAEEAGCGPRASGGPGIKKCPAQFFSGENRAIISASYD